MSVISREDLTAIKQELAELGLSVSESNDVIVAVLTIAAPDKLMADYEIESILSRLKSGSELEDCYGFRTNEAAIELQLPEIWEQHIKITEAKAELVKLATFIAEPGDAENL